MKKRDASGRFTKNTEEGYTHLSVVLPSFQKILFWLLLIFIIFPRVLFISKFKILQKMENIFDSLLQEKSEEISENGKKSGIFY